MPQPVLYPAYRLRVYSGRSYTDAMFPASQLAKAQAEWVLLQQQRQRAELLGVGRPMAASLMRASMADTVVLPKPAA